MNNSSDKNRNLEKAYEIFNEYGDFIRKVFNLKTRDPDLAEDLYQDFFLKIVLKPIPKDVKDVKNYIFRMIINSINASLRRINRQKGHFEKYRQNAKLTITETQAPSVYTKDSELYFNEIKKYLTPSELSAFSLRYKDGLTLDEVAEKMGIKRESARHYLSIGQSKLRKFSEEIKRQCDGKL